MSSSAPPPSTVAEPAQEAGPPTLLTVEQAGEILRSYGLRLRGLWPIRRGTINSNYLVDTDGGPLFLQVAEGKGRAEIGFLASLIWHLGSRGVRTPPLWRTRSGAPFVGWSPGPGQPEKPVLLFGWVEGCERTDAELGPAEARHVGELLALFHLGAASFPLSAPHPGIYTLGHIARRIERVQADPRAEALGPLVAELFDEARRLGGARRRDLPTGIGHGDLFPDNLLFPPRLPRSVAELRTRGGYILDLEQAATLSYAYDLAVTLLAFTAPLPPAPADADAGWPLSGEGRLGPLRLDTARALVAGYESLRVLSEVEWLGLYEELRFASLRFTVTRLTDVEGFGAVSRPRPQPQPAVAAPPPSPERRPPRRLPAGRHSKDYREFLWRWRSLGAVDPAALRPGLR